MSSVETTDGSVSVRKSTTWRTSCSRRLMTSPECIASRPRHSDRNSRPSICCCMRFWALTPRMFLIQTREMPTANSQRMIRAITPTAP